MNIISKKADSAIVIEPAAIARPWARRRDRFFSRNVWLSVTLAAALFSAGKGMSSPLDFDSSLGVVKPLPYMFPLEAPPASPPVLLTGELLSASGFLTAGDPAAAERIARQVTENEPENADAWFMLGLALANLDRREDALAPLARASGLYPVNPLPLVVMGDILMSLGRTDEAETAYEGALDKVPAQWAALEGLGVIAEGRGDFDLAAQHYANASMTAPENRLFPRLQQARLALVNDDPDKALSILVPLAEAGHKDDQLLELLARAHLAKGDPESARDYLSDLVAGGNSLYGYVGMARVVLAKGDGAEAVRLLSIAVRKWPADRALTIEYGNVLGAAGQYADALAVYEILLAEDPDNIGLLRSRGLALSRLDRAEEARETARAVVALDGAGSGDHVRLGALLEADNDLTGAIGSYETAISLDPQNWLALNNLAALLTDDNPSRAVELATRSALLAPEVPAVQDTLAWASYKAGDVARAAEIYEQLQRANPDDAVVLYRLGMVRLAEGRRDDGLAMIQAALTADPDFTYAAEAKAALGQN